MVNLKQISFVFLGLAKVIFSQQSCMKYEENTNLPSGTCYKNVNNTNTDLKLCRDHQYCDYNMMDKTVAGNCKEINYLTGQFLGGPCNEDKDCRQVSAQVKCTANKCTLADQTTCADDYSCAIGQFCGKKNDTNACLSQVAVDEACTRNEECVNDALCRKSNGKCTKVATLKMGDDAQRNEYMLCESGFVLDNKCSMATLSGNNTCTGKCQYEFNNTQINSTMACRCGKNFIGERFCDYGFNSTEQRAIFTAKMDNLNNKNCHTTERLTPCISSAIRQDNTTVEGRAAFDYQKNMRNFHNLMLSNNVEFEGQKPNQVILPVVGGWDMNMITPVQMLNCPAYSCQKNGDYCASSMNPNNWDSTGIQIQLGNVCNSTQSCNLPQESDIYNKETVQNKCVNNGANKQKFPGESCGNNDDCINQNCTNSVCQHVENNGKCSQDLTDLTEQCGVGAYCNKNNTCVDLVERDGKCSHTFDCQNNFVCYNGTCSMEYGKVKDGEFINKTLLDDNFGNYYKYLCESFMFDDTTSKCFTTKYNNETMNVNADGFVQCNRTAAKNECQYQSSLNKSFSMGCQCGFNADGNAYCPIDYDHGK